MNEAPDTVHASVEIISASAETARDLRRYFVSAGVHAAGTHELRPSRLAVTSRAIVLFPDDFVEDEVLAYLRAARVASPQVSVVVVTCHPHRFQNVTAHDGSVLDLIVLPRPSFGWAILDAIRGPAL